MPPPDAPSARADLPAAMRTLARAGLVYSSVGCGSVRDGGRIWITPSRLRYAAMTPADLTAVDLEAPMTRARRRPSSELPLHLAIYSTRPEVRAVRHTHSPCATAWSCLGIPLPAITEDLPYHGLETIRTSNYAPPGSHRLAHEALAALDGSSAALLARHGVLVVAETLDAAVAAAEAVEHQARIAWLLRFEAQLAGPPLTPEARLDAVAP
jgi:L-fuculose-phosphate aldolase